MLVREPDQLGVERAHPQLAFGVGLVELAEPNRHVAADNHPAPTSLDNDHLHAACVARRGDEPEPRKQIELAVDRHVLHAGRVDPLANGVVVLAARVLELPTLDVDRPAGEEWLPPQWSKCRCVLTTMSMPARSRSCLLKGRRRGSRSATAGCSSVMPVSTSTRASGWSMTYT